MNRWIAILGLLLLIQLAGAVAVNMGGDRYAAFQPEEKLLAFDPGVVDGLRITDHSGTLLLKRENGRWSLPDSGGFAARQDGVEQLLEKLAALQKGWPVATTAGAARRFKVDDEQFERKLELLAGSSTVATLYLGSSPGLRKVHARAAGEDDVHAVELQTWDLTSKADDWIDRAAITLQEGDIERLQMPGFALQRNGDGELQLEGLGEGEQTDQKAAATLLGKVAALRIDSLLTEESLPEQVKEKPLLEFTVSLKGGDEMNYRVFQPEGESHYILVRSDLGQYLEIAGYMLDPVVKATREGLLKQSAGEEPEGESGDEEGEQEQGAVETPGAEGQ